jgi:ABC-type Fe3+-siderophore transport system permease subunit
VSPEMQQIFGLSFHSLTEFLSQPAFIVFLIFVIVLATFILISREQDSFKYNFDKDTLKRKVVINKRILIPNITMAFLVSSFIALIYIQFATPYSPKLSDTSAAWIQAGGSILAVATMIYANFLSHHFDREKIRKEELIRNEKRFHLMLKMRFLIEDSPNKIVYSPGITISSDHRNDIKSCITMIDIELDNKVALNETYGALRLFRDHLSLVIENVMIPSLGSGIDNYVEYCISSSNNLLNIMYMFNVGSKY